MMPVVPSTAYEDSFLAMLDDFDTNDPDNAEFYAPARVDFTAYVKTLLDEEQGLNLPANWVPCTHRWLLDDAGYVVGVIRLRHNVDTPFLAENGGHIGYDVTPSERGKGYGHLALRVALQEAELIGLQRVLLYTAEANLPSRAVIERACGRLESVSYSEFWGEQLCKYWVTLRD